MSKILGRAGREFTPRGDYLSMLSVQTLFSSQSENPFEFRPFRPLAKRLCMLTELSSRAFRFAEKSLQFVVNGR